MRAADPARSIVRRLLRRLRIENLVLIREATLDFGPGLNAITGETGAGKTILAQAIGLLLGARGDAALVGPAAADAYVEAELDLPDGFLDEPELSSLAELRPEDEPSLVAARRVFRDGRTRAYAWGRSVPREELAALVERLVAMSGQFEQRRLARPSFQLDVLDSYAGDDQLRRRADLARAWRGLAVARRRHDELLSAASGEAARLADLRELLARTEGFAVGGEEALKAERERLRNVTELAAAAVTAAEALEPEEGETQGAAALAAGGAAALAPAAAIAPELRAVEAELGDAAIRLREAASTLRSFLASLEAEPHRLETVEGELDRISEARRRFGAATYVDLLERRDAAAAELDALEGGEDVTEAAAREVRRVQGEVERLAAELGEERQRAAEPFAVAVSAALSTLAMGGGEFRVELREREAGPTGAEEASFLVRPNPGRPFAPVSDTASGGELSRVALALRTVAHAVAGEPTVVFDEIDAGIGGETAHAVAQALRALGERAQVLTITHLPQIASVAEAHFRVEKVPGDPTHTRIERLGEDERREELERMLGGAEFIAALR